MSKKFIVNVRQIQCQPVLVEVEDNEGEEEAVLAVRNGDGDNLEAFLEGPCDEIQWDVEPWSI